MITPIFFAQQIVFGTLGNEFSQFWSKKIVGIYKNVG